MKLSAIHIIWLVAAATLAAGLLLDIAGFIRPANQLWYAFAGALIVTGGAMPSLSQLKKKYRNG